MRTRRKLVVGLMTLALTLTSFGMVGNMSPVQAAEDNGQVMWRMYNPNSGEHFYTADGNERNSLVSAGWNYEGAGFIASGATAVYRMYNPNVGDHHYTTNAAEKDMLIKAGWNYEGVGWNTEDNGFAVYRLYNPNAVTATHHYTLSEAERDSLVSIGWKYEGVSWNSLHKITTENIAVPNCMDTGYTGDVVCQDTDLTYSGDALPKNPNNHKNYLYEPEVFESWRYAPECIQCYNGEDDPTKNGCGAVLINGVWTKDQELIQNYGKFLMAILEERHRQVYGY